MDLSVDLDIDGDKSVPEQGSFIERRGELWKVAQVNVEDERERTPSKLPFTGFS